MFLHIIMKITYFFTKINDLHERRNDLHERSKFKPELFKNRRPV